ncbi:hypothetical protein D7V86_24855 [bacterium D16-51]|nr:hypothetical protein D7V96_23485 [bacterium D16-59]RKI53610.1 hypothetical protein D7V86_24855 [bacterium D16-51]
MNDAGRIGFVLRGTYDTTVIYDFLDVVHYNGASYVARKQTVGNEPIDSDEYWQVLAKSADFGDYATELSLVKQSVESLINTSVQGEGLEFFVDDEGILNVIYDDEAGDGEEETESETDNPSS